jgi:hypothetical protein
MNNHGLMNTGPGFYTIERWNTEKGSSILSYYKLPPGPQTWGIERLYISVNVNGEDLTVYPSLTKGPIDQIQLGGVSAWSADATVADIKGSVRRLDIIGPGLKDPVVFHISDSGFNEELGSVALVLEWHKHEPCIGQ